MARAKNRQHPRRGARAEEPPWSLASFTTRLEASRWLEPSAALECGDAEALLHLEALVDEYAAALDRVARFMPMDAFALRPWYTRSAWEATARWAEFARRPVEAHDARTRAWHSALVDATLALSRARVERGSRYTTATRLPAVEDAMATAASRSPRWPHAVFEGKPPLRPLARAALYHAEWLDLFHPTPESPSPWAAPLELWMLGVWPFPLEDGVLGVFIPHLGPGRAVVTDPCAADARTDWPERPRFLAAGLDAAFGFGPPARVAP